VSAGGRLSAREEGPRAQEPRADPAPAREDLLRRLAFASLIGLFLFALVAALAYAKAIALPLAAGALIGLILGPTADRLRVYGVPAFVTYGALLLILGAAATAMIAAVAPTLSDWIAHAPELAQTMQQKFSFLQRPLERLLHIGAAQTPGAVVVQEKDSAKMLAGALAFATPAFTQLIVFLFSLVFFLAGRVEFRNRIAMQFHDREDRLAALRAFTSIEVSLLRYFTLVTTINAIVGAITGLTMWGFGMGSPLVWGFIAFTLNFLPLVGPVILKVVLLGAGLVVMPDVASGLAPVLLYTALVTVEANYVTPRIVGSRFTINPFLVFLSVMFWSWLWGFFGALLAMPFVVVATTVLDEVHPQEKARLPG
jgi:predicted PurR-regulated permease PerM